MSNFIRKVLSLDLEEQILNMGAFIAVVGVLLPWIGGEWLGSASQTYSGLSYYTQFLGITILFLQIATISILLVPLAGGPNLVRRQYRDLVRLIASAQSAVLVLASLTVLTRVTFEISRIEVRFGIYVTLIGSLIATVYSFLKFSEQKKHDNQEFFHNHDDAAERTRTILNESIPNAEKLMHQVRENRRVPSVPPPVAPEPEEHRVHS